MLQAHSLLWNYLWIAPNLVLLVVGFLLWKRGLARHFPAFLAFAILGSAGNLIVFAADVFPSMSAPSYWRISWTVLLLDALLKFLVIGEVLPKLLAPYPSISRLGRTLVCGAGAVLVLLGGLVAGFAHGDSSWRLISGYHLFEQTFFVIELGLVVFLFLFAAYFHLSWDRLSFGILLGLGISACVQLATWAVVANAGPSEHTRTLLAFLNLATYHLCVLIWLYYVLVPQRVGTKSEVPWPEDNLYFAVMLLVVVVFIAITALIKRDPDTIIKTTALLAGLVGILWVFGDLVGRFLNPSKANLIKLEITAKDGTVLATNLDPADVQKISEVVEEAKGASQ